MSKKALFLRGISPELLVLQVKNTMPYAFEGQSIKFEGLEAFIDFDPKKELSHVEYFKLCLCAHYSTCATPVPTDVDIQIRQKLWPKNLPLEWALEMAEFTLRTLSWDFGKVSARGVSWGKVLLNGHLGEWFTVATGAYCALKQYLPDSKAEQMQERLLKQIGDLTQDHAGAFADFWKTKDYYKCLLSTTAIAHNFGDMDRAMDMWNLSADDPLRKVYYKLTARAFLPDGDLRFGGNLWVAGQLYKEKLCGSAMAFENHRHFALRKPRILRKKPEYLITIGPFHDQWGKDLARDLVKNSPQDLEDVIENLVQGWERLSESFGYGRALKGIIDECPQYEAKIRAIKKSHKNGKTLDVADNHFIQKWVNAAGEVIEDLPSRAKMEDQ